MGEGQRGGVGRADPVQQQGLQQLGQGAGVDRAGLGETLQAVGEGVEAAREGRVGQLEADQQLGEGRLPAPGPRPGAGALPGMSCSSWYIG
nr:hypothetical protein [Streptomyces sp. SID4940]